MDSIKHGGARVGAGRPKSEEKTQVMRVPASQVDYIKSIIKKPKTKQCVEITDIRILEATTYLEIPLASEKVAAGFPSPAQDYIDKTLDLNEHLIANPVATFIVKVASLSMRDAGLDINDELIVDRSIQAKHNDIVIALVDNEFTVKRLIIENDKKWLKAENPEYKNIYFKDGQELIIWGVVTKVIKNFR